MVALAIAGAVPILFPGSDERLVVQAYLFASEPVTEIPVTSTIPLSSTDSLDPPINNAEVALVKERERCLLVPAPADSGYDHYAGTDLDVHVFAVVDLKVTIGAVTATGRTTVPQPPNEASLSTTNVQTPDAAWRAFRRR